MCVILLLYIDIFKCLKIHNLYIYDYSLAVSITAHNARSRCRRVRILCQALFILFKLTLLLFINIYKELHSSSNEFFIDNSMRSS